MRLESSPAWAQRITGDLPQRWQKKLIHRWDKQRGDHRAGDFVESVHAERGANLALRAMVDRLEVVRIPLDASDSTICQEAEKLAARVSELATVMHTLPLLRGAMERVAIGQGVNPPNEDIEDGPAVARMADPQWWRRKLREMRAKQLEGGSIEMGLVNAQRDIYVSDESVLLRAQQNDRNTASNEATTLVNELGQERTIAELAATGTADKKIRRAELMTRIAGFERISLDMGHVGVFMTITCPSRMHKWSMVPGTRRVYENKKYDGTIPGEAQKHLGEVWARIRAELKRRGIGQYGFRIAEPNHDGTPHWHLLMFLGTAYQGDKRRNAVPRFYAIVRRYALGRGEREQPTLAELKVPGQGIRQARKRQHEWRVAERYRQNSEVGAKKHRVDFKPIDHGKGSAAGYIAKYVAKNIDGYGLTTDLFGNDAVTVSHRVEAWASTWRIHQFQQIGGPPVGPWRELRRVKELPAGVPQHLIDAHNAVNKLAVIEGRENASVAWDRYVKAQGGVFCGRKYRIRVATKEVEGLNKYGEPIGHHPIGVETTEIESYTPAHMVHMGGKADRVVHWVVESVRHVWEVVRKKAGQLIREVFKGPLAPWTCVNNCTESDDGSTGADESGNKKSGFNSAAKVGRCPQTHESDGGGLCGPPAFGNFGYQFGT